ncbi:MAG: GNAT family N-acetyltransferase [Gemmatimonadaceae bacterium]
MRTSSAPARVAPLAPTHRGRIAEILRATGVFGEEEVAVALELFNSLPATDSDYTFLGAFTPEEELVGYVCYGPTPGTDRTYDLYWIAVEPGLHGAGIGTILLTEVERRLQGHSARLLVVETSSRSDYAPTRGFYRRRGYGETARVREFYAPGDDRIILTKRFHSPTPGGEQRHHE